MNQMLCNVSGIQNKEQKTQIKNSLNKIFKPKGSP